MNVLVLIILLFVGLPLLWVAYVYWRMRRGITQLRQAMRQAQRGYRQPEPQPAARQRQTGGEYADFEDLAGPVTQPPAQPSTGTDAGSRPVIEDAEFEEID